MQLTAGEVADFVGGEVHGDADRVVRGVCALSEDGVAVTDHLAFLTAKADCAKAVASQVGTVLVATLPPSRGDRTWIRVDDPALAHAKTAQRFHPLPRAVTTSVHPTAVIAEAVDLCEPVEIGPHVVVEGGVRIGAGTIIMAGSFVGAGCRIGGDCLLHPRVVLYEGVSLGDRVRIHSGAVIGADGFGNAKDGSRYERIPQIGDVVLEDDVEIGANTTVDRATFSTTRVRRGTKIDNLVMVAHNCDVGEDSALAGQVGMAGTAKIGARCMLGGQAGVSDHIVVNDDVVVGGKSGVMADIEQPGYYAGMPAQWGRDFMRQVIEWRRLSEMRRRVIAVEDRLDALDARD
ncbi:MAG: UDP-3-O-(3-hydroxymyristoyl)glucosamine N-acyltransferase [Planctomycetota bacterium]|jgi:UDP-3-O-[3-hydroxymyristoyl] glucosamine N-acyltransferase|nr:UDP-3-O-(3-hydroxymyristoyl)glucosamine N-acyltransferase [Planctomycetota bacterium]